MQRMLDKHGGRFWAEDEEGRGAAFCFTLAPDPPSRPARSASARTCAIIGR